MVEVGDTAPDFTALLAGDFPPEEFTLSEHVGDGPIVLAFFPGAFTGGCTQEMCSFRDELDGFDAVDAEVYGISVDSPAALQEWKEKHDLGFDLLSDFNREVIDKYDVVLEEIGGLQNLADRAVFVVDTDGTISYKWAPGDARQMPDIDEVQESVAAA